MNNNIIPEMTHPLSRAWDQPSKDEIIIDEANAVMTSVTFSKLKNYSHSMPSGVYEGKMWRSVYKGGADYLHWYGTHENPNLCSHNVRLILIIE